MTGLLCPNGQVVKRMPLRGCNLYHRHGRSNFLVVSVLFSKHQYFVTIFQQVSIKCLEEGALFLFSEKVTWRGCKGGAEWEGEAIIMSSWNIRSEMALERGPVQLWMC